jgi:hypothetical protein
MKSTKITGIGRPLDPKYTTNIAIVLFSILAGLVIGVRALSSGMSLLVAFLEAFNAGVTLFLGWALTREYDPDHPFAAFLAALAVLLVSVFIQRGSLILLAFLLVMLRFITRTTGVPATLLDQSAGLGLAAWLSFSVDWIIGILAAAAYALDGLLSEDGKLSFVFAFLSLLVAAGALIQGPRVVSFLGMNVHVLSLSLLFVVLSLPLIRAYRSVESMDDSDQTVLNPQRIRAAQVFFVAATILIGMKRGLQPSGDMLAAGSVIAAAAVFYLLSSLIPSIPQGEL